jgi:hypothetical protein
VNIISVLYEMWEPILKRVSEAVPHEISGEDLKVFLMFV